MNQPIESITKEFKPYEFINIVGKINMDVIGHSRTNEPKRIQSCIDEVHYIIFSDSGKRKIETSAIFYGCIFVPGYAFSLNN